MLHEEKKCSINVCTQSATSVAKTGHIAPNCPKGKGKGKGGKGKGKGKDGPKGKSKGKGGKGGCAICGDPGHWKNECPQNPEKGTGKTFSLCAIQEAPLSPKPNAIVVHNSFADLAEERSSDEDNDRVSTPVDSDDEDEIRVPDLGPIVSSSESESES